MFDIFSFRLINIDMFVLLFLIFSLAIIPMWIFFFSELHLEQSIQEWTK